MDIKAIRKNLKSLYKNKRLVQYCRDPLYVYKSHEIDWILILKKLDDTITNELTHNSVYSETSKYRANKLQFVDMFHKFDNTIKNENISYYIGTNITSNNFPNALDTSGIQYYKTIAPAFFDQITENKISLMKFTGSFFRFHDNGVVLTFGHYKNGLKFGLWKEYFINGCPRSKGTYKKNLQHGKWTYYYTNGNYETIGFCYNNLKHGKWTYYNIKGDVESQGHYKYGLESGKKLYFNVSNIGTKMKTTYGVKPKKHSCWFC